MPVQLAPNERPQTVEVAREIINEIRRDRGNIDANDEIELSKTSPEWQEDYKQREEKRRKDYARYTKTKLYTSKFRFIHEVLQNADDAEYRPGDSATLTFHVRPNELVVDSNEKGFTRANVQAICSTGESSKLQDLDTTGEKGLGFKSNFGIANKIHVQSGLWSFRFEHGRGESGLGMVTPIWTQRAAEPLPDGIGTRFRLTYATQTKSFVEKIVAEFDKVTDTIIFALRKIKKLVIAFDDVMGRQYQKSFERTVDATTDEKMTITTFVSGPTVASSSRETIWRVVRLLLEDLPEEEWRLRDTTEIALGFELSSFGAPVIPARGQHVFAYLPVQRLSGLPFIIQGDFVLAANREAIPENDWNEALVDGVAETFLEAIISFCKPGDPLRYRWVEYVPSDWEGEGVWYGLDSAITSKLKSANVLESRSLHTLKIPAALRAIPKRFTFNGEPLFADLPRKDLYLSERYSNQNVQALKCLGLIDLKSNEAVDRISYDIQMPDSRLHTTDLEDDWHTAFLSYISYLIKKSKDSRVTELDIIPLTTGDWVSRLPTSRRPVYLPYAVDEDSMRIEIPGNVGLQALHTKACVVSERRSVYALLGVSDCEPKIVVNAILAAQKLPVSGLVQDWVRQFEILFWYGHVQRLSSVDMIAIDQASTGRKARNLFSTSAEPYDAMDLLGTSAISEVSGYGFINDLYSNSSVATSPRNKDKWLEWLEKVAGVRKHPELLDQANKSMHPLLKITARDNPPKFLGALRAHWKSSYRQACTGFERSALIQKQLRQITVQCRNGQGHQLYDTILPTPEAISRSKRFGVEIYLQFLSLPPDAWDNEDPDWRFLQQFGVICDPDLAFHFKALEALRLLQPAEDRKPDAIVNVYQSLVTIATMGDQNVLKEKFSSARLICQSPSGQKWYSPNDCIWTGHSVLWTKPIISNAYKSFPQASKLFVDLLGLRNANCDDFLNDLTKFRDTHPMPECLERLKDFYKALSEMVDSFGRATLRDTFEKQSLIYIRDRWIKPSQAVWNCTIPISGLQSVGELYPNLEMFFRNEVGVRTMSLRLLVEQLVEVTRPGSTPDGNEVKAIMINIGQALAADRSPEEVRDSLKALKQNRCLPVRRGDGWVFVKPGGTFFVVDHERFAALFADKVNLLDFTYPELSSLHPLFQVLGLEHRYLSRHVDPETVVSKGTAYVSSDLTQHFRRRAHALSCCAIFHQSPEYLNKNSRLHKLLDSVEVLLCEDMWTKLIIRAAEGDVEARSDRALVKLEQTEGNLKIYMPSNKAGLYSSLRTELPAELVSTLGITDAKATKQVYRILNDEASSLDAILKDEYIPQVTWLKSLSEPQVDRRNQGPMIPSLAQQIREPGCPSTEESETSSHHESPPSTPPPAYPDDEILPNRLPGDKVRDCYLYPGGIIQQVVQKNAYRKILQNVVKQARQLASSKHGSGRGLNGSDTFSMSNITAALDDLDPTFLRRRFGLGGDESARFAEMSKLGAAGELYVFERLLGLSMPDFTLSNWQSTIRSLVRILPEYVDLENWPLPEVSDLVYETTLDTFEDFLRRNAFNSFPSWPAASHSTGEPPIRYLIEVKTTTGVSSTPFFMSRNQYQLMEDNALQDEDKLSERPTTVYVLFRVYSLASERIGLKIFVDPWHLRKGPLNFKSGSWTVTGP